MKQYKKKIENACESLDKIIKIKTEKNTFQEDGAKVTPFCIE